MALNPLSFVLAEGGIGTPIPGSDYISSAVFYAAAAPSGFTLGTAKALFGITDAEAAGILNDYNDETKATGTLTLVKGSTGDTVKVTVTEPGINGTSTVVNLGTYTQVSGDSTDTLLATSVKNMINLGTPTHGYSATSAIGVVTLIARTGLGIALNSGTPIAKTVTGTMTCTIAQFSAGVASKQAIYHYQISEYFRLQPSGKLWVAFFAVPVTYTFTEIDTVQTQANGEIRQFGIYSPNGTSVSNINADLDAIQAVGVTMFNEYQPAQVIYSGNIFGITDLSTLSNLRLRSDNYVSCVISQDGGALGALLSLTTGTSVCNWGACLGTVSVSAVENSIAWVGAFNVSNGTENEVKAFGNGSLLSAISSGLKSQLDSYGYIFTKGVVGKPGSFWNGSHVSTLITSDYAYIERNRVIQKAQRIIYTTLIPLANSNLYTIGSTGNLTAGSINVFKNAVSPSMNQMVSNGEVSAYAVIIDPTQNVLSTSTIRISVKIVGVGIARNISVTLGFSLSI